MREFQESQEDRKHRQAETTAILREATDVILRLKADTEQLEDSIQELMSDVEQAE